jgi:hypothetical protein
MGVGALVGTAVTAFKHFRIWPFNKKVKRPRRRPYGAAEAGETPSKVKRGHARAWTLEDTY